VKPTAMSPISRSSRKGRHAVRYFGPDTPTSTTVEVGRLGGLDFMIEMESIATLVTELLSAAVKRGIQKRRIRATRRP
jgi:hypothetical protein